MVNRLLDAGAEVNTEPVLFKEQTALNLAVKTGNAYVVQRLLDAGAIVNTKHAPTALQVAVASGYWDIVERLLDARAGDMLWPMGGESVSPAAAGAGYTDLADCLRRAAREEKAHVQGKRLSAAKRQTAVS